MKLNKLKRLLITTFVASTCITKAAEIVNTSFETSEGWPTGATVGSTITDKQTLTTADGLIIEDYNSPATTASTIMVGGDDHWSQDGTQSFYLRGKGSSVIMTPVDTSNGIGTVKFSVIKWTTTDPNMNLRVYKKVGTTITEFNSDDLPAYVNGVGVPVPVGTAATYSFPVNEPGEASIIFENNNVGEEQNKGLFIDLLVMTDINLATSFEVADGWPLETVTTSSATATNKKSSVTYGGLTIADNASPANTLSHLIKETEGGFANDGTQAIWLRGPGASMILDPVRNDGIAAVTFSHKKWTSQDPDMWLRVFKKVDEVVTEITSSDVLAGGYNYENGRGFYVNTTTRFPVIAINELKDVQIILTNSNEGASPAFKGIFIDELEIIYNPITALDREALALDGINDYVEMPNNSAYDKVDGGGMTVEMWVKTTDSKGTLISNYDETGGEGEKGGFELVYGDAVGRLNARIICDDADSGYLQGAPNHNVTLDDDKWHNVAMVVDNNSIATYVDGVKGPAWTNSGITKISSSDHVLRIGAESTNSDLKEGYLDASFSEVRIWNIARTPAQLVGNKYKTIPATTPGLVGYWKLDDLADVLEDSVPAATRAGANDGALFGATTATDSYLWENDIQVSNDPDYIFTPVLGMEITQTGTELTWTIEEEVGVEKYLVIDSITGELIATVLADGSTNYSITLPEGVNAKLVVVDNSGFKQTFYPENGNLITTAYDLAEGWNLIAITGDNADLSNLPTQMWTWKNSAYELMTNPTPTQAVWVYVTKAYQATVTAEKSDKGIELTQGWNMVGPVENTPVMDDALIIYGWSDSYQQVLESSNTLLQGVGYWIFKL